MLWLALVNAIISLTVNTVGSLMEIDPANYPVAIATFQGSLRLGWRDGEVYVFDGVRVTVEKLRMVGAKFFTHAEVEAAMLEWESHDR